MSPRNNHRINDEIFIISDQKGHDRVTVSQQAIYQIHETKAMIPVIIPEIQGKTIIPAIFYFCCEEISFSING